MILLYNINVSPVNSAWKWYESRGVILLIPFQPPLPPDGCNMQETNKTPLNICEKLHPIRQHIIKQTEYTQNRINI